MFTTLKTLTLSALAALTLGTAGTAVAAPPTTGPAPKAHVIDRQVNQQHRIMNGVKSGELTRPETVRLEQQQVRIQKTKRAMVKNDGKLGPVERAKLERMQNKASRNIFKAKHNGRSR